MKIKKIIKSYATDYLTLIKYKELLDEGALTQEEFDKLKNELING